MLLVEPKARKILLKSVSRCIGIKLDKAIQESA